MVQARTYPYDNGIFADANGGGLQGEITMTAGTWLIRIPVAVIVSQVYLVTSLLQNAFGIALKFTAWGVSIAIVEILIGMSIAAGKTFLFASGLVLLGTLVSAIPMFHSLFLRPLPDYWEVAVILLAGGILICSFWIAGIIEYFPASHGLESFNGNPINSDSGQSDQEVEITFRLDSHGFGILSRRRCIVTIFDLRGLTWIESTRSRIPWMMIDGDMSSKTVNSSNDSRL